MKDQPDPERASEDTEDLLKEIKRLKSHLMKKMTAIYEVYKKELSKKSSKESVE